MNWDADFRGYSQIKISSQLFVLAMPSLASVAYMRRFERFHSRDPLAFKTPGLAADDFADFVGLNQHRHRSLLI
jgi:hypothetical protein